MPYVLDEVDNLNDQAMATLKSVMNTPGCVFILTANHFDAIEAGVRNRCHCIPFMAAPAQRWLPPARRVISDAGITGISDQQLIDVIATVRAAPETSWMPMHSSSPTRRRVVKHETPIGGNAAINHLLWSPQGFAMVGWGVVAHLDQSPQDDGLVS